jgi:hypothetical protein
VVVSVGGAADDGDDLVGGPAAEDDAAAVKLSSDLHSEKTEQNWDAIRQ